MKKFFTIIIVVGLLFGAVYFLFPVYYKSQHQTIVLNTNVKKIERKVENKTAYWGRATDGVEKQVIDKVDPEADPNNPKAPHIMLTMYRIDPKKFEVRLVNDSTKPKTVVEWSKEYPKTTDTVVINGGYFNEDKTPTGFIAIDGARLGAGQFDLDKSGLIQFKPSFKIVDTKTSPVTLDAAKLGTAMQSYPFFISGRKPVIEKDSGQESRRSFIGTDIQGNIIVGISSDALITLYELQQMLDVNEGPTTMRFTQALNLDGGGSTGIAATLNGNTAAFDSLTPVPSAIVITRRADVEKDDE